MRFSPIRFAGSWTSRQRALVALDGEFPPMPGQPGDPGVERQVDGRRLSAAVGDLGENVARDDSNGGLGQAPEPRSPQGPVGVSPGELSRLMKQIVSYGRLAGMTGIIEAMRQSR